MLKHYYVLSYLRCPPCTNPRLSHDELTFPMDWGVSRDTIVPALVRGSKHVLFFIFIFCGYRLWVIEPTSKQSLPINTFYFVVKYFLHIYSKALRFFCFMISCKSPTNNVVCWRCCQLELWPKYPGYPFPSPHIHKSGHIPWFRLLPPAASNKCFVGSLLLKMEKEGKKGYRLNFQKKIFINGSETSTGKEDDLFSSWAGMMQW